MTKKIKALRSTYYLDLAKIEKIKRSGGGTDFVYKPSLPWFDDTGYIMKRAKGKETCSNSVVPNVGLCIALFDIQELSDSFIFPGDGAAHTKVTFRYVVFRPFIDEIIVGKIRSCSKDGVQLTLGFFDDIVVPPGALQHPSRFDETEQVWIWEFENDGEKHDLFMDPGEKIKFRVTGETFVETSPIPCPESQEIASDQNKEPKVPYSITASINEPGLGVLTWWAGA